MLAYTQYEQISVHEFMFIRIWPLLSLIICGKKDSL